MRVSQSDGWTARSLARLGPTDLQAASGAKGGASKTLHHWCCQRSQSILCLLRCKLGLRVLINTDTTSARNGCPMGPGLQESQRFRSGHGDDADQDKKPRYVPLPSRGRIGAARAAEHGLCSRMKDSILVAKRHPLHAGVARRAGAAQEDNSAQERLDLEEAAGLERERAELVEEAKAALQGLEEDHLLARQQLKLALAQQETAQERVAMALQTGNAEEVQEAERKVEEAERKVQEAEKEVEKAK
ncbi:unnamed protein product, partial [Effrenium voratum]